MKYFFNSVFAQMTQADYQKRSLLLEGWMSFSAKRLSEENFPIALWGSLFPIAPPPIKQADNPGGY